MNPQRVEIGSFGSKSKLLNSIECPSEAAAGYGRHRTVYRKNGISGLKAELRTELGRLWKRNCVANLDSIQNPNRHDVNRLSQGPGGGIAKSFRAYKSSRLGGRDDRLISDHARELRHPFLDEAFIWTVKRLPLPCVAVSVLSYCRL